MTEERGRQIGYAEDENYSGCYEWGFAAVYFHQRRFYIITDSGCSYNGPASFYPERDAVVGPAATLGGLLDELVVDKDKHPKHVKEAFLDAVKTINDETLASTRKVLDL